MLGLDDWGNGGMVRKEERRRRGQAKISIKSFCRGVQGGRFLQKGGRRPQPIHGQTDAVLSELHLKSLPKKQSFRRYY